MTNNDILKKNIIEALKKSMGIVSTACKLIGISRETYYRWYKEDDEFMKRVDEVSEMTLDIAESKLLELVEDKNPAAIFFYLKCKGKKRGYVEKSIIEYEGEQKIQVYKLDDNTEIKF